MHQVHHGSPQCTARRAVHPQKVHPIYLRAAAKGRPHRFCSNPPPLSDCTVLTGQGGERVGRDVMKFEGSRGAQLRNEQSFYPAKLDKEEEPMPPAAVSYTHLTLPTILLV